MQTDADCLWMSCCSCRHALCVCAVFSLFESLILESWFSADYNLSLCELLSEAEPVEVWGGECDLDLVYSSMEVLHLCLQTQHVLRSNTDT